MDDGLNALLIKLFLFSKKLIARREHLARARPSCSGARDHLPMLFK